jgi:hypothetical protein
VARCLSEAREIRAKRSFDRDCDYVAVIKRLLGTVVMKELGREHLFRFKSQRIKEHIVRGGKEIAKTVSPGELANEFSCLRHMMNKARENNVEAGRPVVCRLDSAVTARPGADQKEEKAMLEIYPAWLGRVAIVAQETCLSRDDIIRPTRA